MAVAITFLILYLMVITHYLLAGTHESFFIKFGRRNDCSFTALCLEEIIVLSPVSVCDLRIRSQP